MSWVEVLKKKTSTVSPLGLYGVVSFSLLPVVLGALKKDGVPY